MTDLIQSEEQSTPATPPRAGAGGRLLARLRGRGRGTATPGANDAAASAARNDAPWGARQHRTRSLQRSLAVAVLVVGVLFFVWQATLLSQQRGASDSLHDSVQHAAAALAKPLVAARGAVATAVTDPQVLAAMAGDSAADRNAARRRLRALLPDASSVSVNGPHLGVLLNANLAELGYVRAAQLARAQSDGTTQVGVLGHRSGQRRLSVVMPVRQADQVLGYVAVELPFAAIGQAFAQQSLAPGRVELRLGPRAEAAVLLGRGSGAHVGVDDAVQIGASGLWLTATAPPSVALLPRDFAPAAAWALALTCLAIAIAIAVGERRLRALHGSLRNRRRGAEPTFAEMVENAPPEAPRRGAKTPATSAADEPAAAVALAAPAPVGIAVKRSIFRAYDIRGICGKTLDAGVAWLIGRAIASAAREQELYEVVVGRDGRLSGPELADALAAGMRASGVDVIDIGAAPTPLVYFACHQLKTGCGVAVTGSHNPPDYNGFKIVIGGVTLAGEAIQDLYARVAEGRFHEGSGSLRHLDVSDDYVQRVADDVQIERPISVVADCGNGIAGAIAPRLLEAIGATVTPLYDEVDGSFPNHHPDPSDPRNLDDLILAVKHQQADLGIAFDGDGDRLGVVTRGGEIIYPDRLLMLFAIDVLARDPGATIIYDVKCTGHLQSVILRHGGSPLMCQTGHSLIKAKMTETGAALAGEMSGHFFFAERWYGFDDGLYAAARLLEILAADPEARAAETIFAALPKGVSTPELHIDIDDGAAFVGRLRESATFEDARLTTIDGVRADWPDGWGLVRASNTMPVLVLRFDADNQAALERIEDVFRTQLLALDPDMKLPF